MNSNDFGDGSGEEAENFESETGDSTLWPEEVSHGR